MAIITEHDEDNHINQSSSPSKSKPKPKSKPESQSKPQKPKSKPPRTTQTQTQNPFIFWFYFTIIVSLITFTSVLLSSFSTPDPKTWFLKLPTILKNHYSNGRTIKVQITPNEPPIEVFTYSKGKKTSENVLIIHGLGCSSFTFRKLVDDLASKGLFGVAIDLPGSGFSDKTVVREREFVNENGLLGRLFEVYEEIKEKGLFWGFDHMIEKGHLPYDEVKIRVSKRDVVEPLDFGGVEFGIVLGQVVDSMGLAPLHLVLHDSALVMGANWVAENVGLLKSVTLVDTLPRGTVLPLWALQVPVIRDVVLRVDFVFGRLMGSCCSRAFEGSSVEAHRVLLSSRDGRETVVGIGRNLNQSFDLAEWARMEGVKGLPMQVLWSGSWSQEWNEEGKRVAEVISKAKIFKHSGGRWPQDETSIEIADNIVSLITSLPKTERKADDEPLPEHIQKLLNEAKSGGNNYHHGHGDHDGHSHGHGDHADYMDAYGLGEGRGWGM